MRAAHLVAVRQRLDHYVRAWRTGIERRDVGDAGIAGRMRSMSGKSASMG